MQDKPYIFLPVETKVRELHSKTLLACYAAEAGFSVVLGQQAELLRRIKFLPAGIYVEKGVAPMKAPGVRLLKDLGHKVAAWCEEGLVIVDQETYARDRVSEEVFSMLDAFYAWGEVQAGAIALKMGDQTEKTVIAGNPRFDLLREPYRIIFEKDAQDIRSRHGEFLLVNTNFGLFNNFFGRDYFVENLMRRYGRIQGPEHEAFLKEWVAHVGRVFEAYKAFLPALSKAFPNLKIVLRPHPSENHEEWKEAARGLSNVEVIHQGNVIPWILASRVLVHNSCTTGVESYILGKPVVAYRPVLSPVYEYELPKAVSISAFSQEETIQVIQDCLDDKLKTAPEIAVGRKYARNIDGPYSCETIVESLKALAQERRPESYGALKAARARLSWIAKDGLYGAKVMVNNLIGRKGEYQEYEKQKTGVIKHKEVEDIIRAFAQSSGLFSSVHAKTLNGAKMCLKITKD
ncbi:surface carbohydrate biosynthesis protein [Desulfatibacillum alkenivorans DSM 16219]|jgi:surface carbohydrate biosynthesis protein|uniref:Surface carbohydrate biosynthesis protein n=1 Tax=Desulfatibacillum alkenivorans DSM 16219 TaxID=1121393 RepID=A0A1M6RYA9_9BACT|nr:surface carbohydrate biosynthesis protein [Desulfatibacillum alkenivorans]SHK37433.1 surface carbohydrate biosynthesis protein [Desulfatibacillum alkenivorans DSM 16219]